jgi:hypothetical protein
MRAVESATWTSGEPVSFSARLYSAINLPLTAVSSAKPKRKYTGRRLAAVRGPRELAASGSEFVGLLSDVLDGAIRTRICPRTPGPGSVDDDRLRVAQGVVPGGLQLDV